MPKAVIGSGETGGAYDRNRLEKNGSVNIGKSGIYMSIHIPYVSGFIVDYKSGKKRYQQYYKSKSF